MGWASVANGYSVDSFTAELRLLERMLLRHGSTDWAARIRSVREAAERRDRRAPATFLALLNGAAAPVDLVLADPQADKRIRIMIGSIARRARRLPLGSSRD
jgi:hypothetical protein